VPLSLDVYYLLSVRASIRGGDEGHEVIGLIADHYLEPAVRARVQSILTGDTTQLTTQDVAHEATWAEKISRLRSQRDESPVQPNAELAFRGP
jgi:hypothetical protein